MSKSKNPGSKNRVPVKYQGHVLMPMLWRRARQFIKEGKARKWYDRKTHTTWLHLLVEPSRYETQDIVLAIDPGSTFDGYSVISKECHHTNHEHIQRPKKPSQNSAPTISSRLGVKVMYRRLRRTRLWHRKARFDNRTYKKIWL